MRLRFKKFNIHNKKYFRIRFFYVPVTAFCILSFSIRKNNFNRENISVHKIWNFIKYKIPQIFSFFHVYFAFISCTLFSATDLLNRRLIFFDKISIKKIYIVYRFSHCKPPRVKSNYQKIIKYINAILISNPKFKVNIF